MPQHPICFRKSPSRPRPSGGGRRRSPIGFGASAGSEPSCRRGAPCGTRCGDRQAFSRIRRQTRSLDTRIPERMRSRAPALRWPSPTKGEVSRSARMTASRSRSGIFGFGPRRTGGSGTALAISLACWAGIVERGIPTPGRPVPGRRACRHPARSRGSSRRPPPDPRALHLPFLAQNPDFHDPFAEAPVGIVKLMSAVSCAGTRECRSTRPGGRRAGAPRTGCPDRRGRVRGGRGWPTRWHRGCRRGRRRSAGQVAADGGSGGRWPRWIRCSRCRRDAV